MFVYYKYYISIELTFLKEFDLNKGSASKEYDISHYWHFLNKGFKLQPNVCNTLFFNKKNVYKKTSLKNTKTLRKCYENPQPQIPELQFLKRLIFLIAL